MGKPTLQEIGEAGELLITSFFRGCGCVVVKSHNKYDMHKDILVNNVCMEIKTQTVYRRFPLPDGTKQPAFTVDIETAYGKIYHNQLKKCMSVERLIFVARSSRDDDDPCVIIYEAQPVGKRKYYEHRNEKDGRLVAGFLISEMTVIAKITKDTYIHDISGEYIINYFMDEWKGKNAKSLQYS